MLKIFVSWGVHAQESIEVHLRETSYRLGESKELQLESQDQIALGSAPR